MTDDTWNITISQTMLTPPSQVYAAFTRAEGWREWCAETAEVDCSIGGKLHIYTEGYNAYGEFTNLEQDRNIAFTWNGDREPPTHIQVRLNGQENGTLVTFQVTVFSSEQDGGGFRDFLERTWGRALKNLKSVLETDSQ
jgi:uncharacterized protein YndB with AHSA1/START domain